MKAKLLLLGLIISPLMADAMTRAQELRMPTKFFVVRPVTNPAAPFWINVNVDNPNRMYTEGEQMVVTVKSEKQCYFYLLYLQGEQAVCLLPNKYEKNNLVPADTEVRIPSGKDADFILNAEPPHGKGVLVALATLKEVDLWDAGQKPQDSAEGLRDLSVDELKRFAKRVQELPKGEWAEFRIDIETSATKVTRQPKRHAICIGIGPYPKENGIPPLRVSHLDAKRVAKALEGPCGVNGVVLLVNEQATRAAIEQAFLDLADKAEPGDTVFIYYSGHGWRVADVDGDEADGFDEAFVPWDAKFGQVETMILDDVFANWVRRFDACHVGIILDCCYAGGAPKGLQLPKGGPKGIFKQMPKPDLADFIDGELERARALQAHAKNLTQAGTVVIAACQPDQLAWEMPAEDQGSVFTYHILKLIGPVAAGQQASQSKDIKTADANADGHLSLGELHKAVCQPVQDYVKQKFQENQTPVLLDNAKDEIVIRP